MLYIPLNLPLSDVNRLQSDVRYLKRNYLIESVKFSDFTNLVFVSPKGPKKNSNKSAKRPKIQNSRSRRTPLSKLNPEQLLKLFDNSGYKDSLHIVDFIIQGNDVQVIADLICRLLSDRDARLHKIALQLVCMRYKDCDQLQRQKMLSYLRKWLPRSSYRPIPILLTFAQAMLKDEMDDEEWRFLEYVISHCVYIKSPEITNGLNSIFQQVRSRRNIVLYISSSKDAHYVDYLEPMQRSFFFVLLDPYLALYVSPQGYPIPLENVLTLFELATHIWWRKPSVISRKFAPLEEFTRIEIIEFVRQLRTKYKEKAFPQSLPEDQKFIYLDTAAKNLQTVQVCMGQFENSTFLWKKGDFIKALSTQALFTRKGVTGQHFSPFIYSGSRSQFISILPPLIRQPRIKKKYEVRGTFFVDNISAVRIDTPKLKGQRGKIDWRYSSDLFEHMRPYDLPNEIAEDLTLCFRKMGLNFCTFDLIFNGTSFYLLDINYNGQWIFADEKCGLIITRKILAHLAKQNPTIDNNQA